MSDECKHVILNDNMFVNNACKYKADTGMILLSQKKDIVMVLVGNI